MRTPNVSLWMDQVAQLTAIRPSLTETLELDIAIVGAGYTGLWTAWYLKQHAPLLRIAIFEAQQVGHGASGRNGGWLLGRIAGLEEMLQHLPSDEKRAFLTIVQQIPDDVERELKRAQIDCSYRKGGVLSCAARYPEQWQWLQNEIRALHDFGYSEDDYRLLSASELAEQMRVSNAYGGMFSPHCATIHPAQLAFGLASNLEKQGVRIYENTRVESFGHGQLRVGGHLVKADWVVPCVEGYAKELPPLGKYQLAVQSLQIATAPLSEAQWAEIGLSNGQAAHECSRQVSYFHRSRDDRLVFGARGSYRFGGRLREDFSLSESELVLRRNLVLDLFPQLSDTPIEYGWGGNLGMTRNFRPYMLCDQQQKTAHAGGYGGEGIGAAYLAGRTLADLILGRESIYTLAPWVLQGSISKAMKRWEPEPFRWIGYGGVSAAYSFEDSLLSNPDSAQWQRKMATALAVQLSHLVSPDVKVG